MTRTTDRFRPPYGKRVIEAPRQCVFVGTANLDSYLKDETGNRRFWPVKCGRIDIDALRENRDQIWAEAIAEYHKGHPWWLENRDLVKAAEAEQAERYLADAWDQPVQDYLLGKNETSIADILQTVLNLPQGQWTQQDQNRVARCLIAAGWKRYRRRFGDRREWRYQRGFDDRVGPVVSKPNGHETRDNSNLVPVGPSLNPASGDKKAP